ncbi:unnamed protein product [Prunus armeniaca]
MVDLDAEPVSKHGRQTKAPKVVFTVEDDDGPAEPINIVCPPKTVQFANHMILGSQMELSEIEELPRRPVVPSASMDIWLCVKRAISATECAEKAYDDGRAKDAEAGMALQDHAHLLKDKQAAERQVKASETKLTEMRVALDAVVTAAKDTVAAKEAVQVALEESKLAKAAEIEATV